MERTRKMETPPKKYVISIDGAEPFRRGSTLVLVRYKPVFNYVFRSENPCEFL